MGQRRDTTVDSVSDRTETDESIEQFWSTLSMGCLFVVAGVVSPAVHALSGNWSAGYGGLGAAAFAVVGVGLVGYSLALGS